MRKAMDCRAAKRLSLIPILALTVSTALASEISGRIILQKSIDKTTVIPAQYDLRGIAIHDHPAEPKTSGVWPPNAREPRKPSGEMSEESKPNRFDRVAVWLESVSSQPPPPVTAVMQQRNRRLEPELLVVPVGSTVEFPNLDPIFHNIFSLSNAQTFDLGYYPKGKSRSIVFRRSGIVQVYCHVHPNMYGAIVVTSSRWFGKPAADGTFSWSDVPAGNYRLMAWQKFAGLFARDVAVPQSAGINVILPLPDDPENR